jgi:hypothetical protein
MLSSSNLIILALNMLFVMRACPILYRFIHLPSISEKRIVFGLFMHPKYLQGKKQDSDSHENKIKSI